MFGRTKRQKTQTRPAFGDVAQGGIRLGAFGVKAHGRGGDMANLQPPQAGPQGRCGPLQRVFVAAESQLYSRSIAAFALLAFSAAALG